MSKTCEHGNVINPPASNCLFCIAGQTIASNFNHNEAWSLAHHKASESNLARCYIELREAVAKIEFLLPEAGSDGLRLREIIHANDL